MVGSIKGQSPVTLIIISPPNLSTVSLYLLSTLFSSPLNILNPSFSTISTRGCSLFSIEVAKIISSIYLLLFNLFNV